MNKIDKFSRLIGYSCSVLIFSCIVLSTYEVILRYGFNNPTVWSFEIIMAICATSWVLSVGYVTEQKRHISITMLELLVTKRIWKKFELLQLIISIFAISVLAFAIMKSSVSSLQHLERSGSAFNPILPTYLKTLLFIGCILYLLQLLSNMAKWWNLHKKGRT